MRVLLFAFFVSSLFSLVKASDSCEEYLLDGHRLDSRVIIMAEAFDKVSSNELNLKASKTMVEEVLRPSGCLGASQSKAGLFQASLKGRCVEVMPGNISSTACYLENDWGYFMVTMDMMENAHIVFSRWD